MLEKKGVVFSKRRSTHRVLWICSGLSTAEAAKTAFLGANQSLDRICLPDSPPDEASQASCRALTSDSFPGPAGAACAVMHVGWTPECTRSHRLQPGEPISLPPPASRFLPNHRPVDCLQRVASPSPYASRFFQLCRPQCRLHQSGSPSVFLQTKGTSIRHGFALLARNGREPVFHNAHASSI